MRNAEFGMRNAERTEAMIWLELLDESKLLPAAKLTAIKQEADELIAITVTSIKTARRNRAPDSAFRTPHSAFA